MAQCLLLINMNQNAKKLNLEHTLVYVTTHKLWRFRVPTLYKTYRSYNIRITWSVCFQRELQLHLAPQMNGGWVGGGVGGLRLD